MKRIVLSLAFVTTTFALTPVHAAGGLVRTFVSSAGVDSNPCTIAAPCATFAAAYAAVQASGIVAALDPGKYGPLTITGPVTINGNGWAAITAPAAGNGITVNAGSGIVTLIGLEIDGAGSGSGSNGIVLNSAGDLTVTNCVLQNFGGSGTPPINFGILMQPTSGTLNFAITNTAFSNNAIGIAYEPPSGSTNANGTIDHVIATDANQGGSGIAFVTVNAAGGRLVAAITNSITSNNGAGVLAENDGSPSTILLSIDNLTASGNFEGILASGTTNVLLGRSVITGNTHGIINNTSPNSFYTYKDNRINQNALDDISGVTPTLNTTLNVQ